MHVVRWHVWLYCNYSFNVYSTKTSTIKDRILTDLLRAELQSRHQNPRCPLPQALAFLLGPLPHYHVFQIFVQTLSFCLALLYFCLGPPMNQPLESHPAHRHCYLLGLPHCCHCQKHHLVFLQFLLLRKDMVFNQDHLLIKPSDINLSHSLWLLKNSMVHCNLSKDHGNSLLLSILPWMRHYVHGTPDTNTCKLSVG